MLEPLRRYRWIPHGLHAIAVSIPAALWMSGAAQAAGPESRQGAKRLPARITVPAFDACFDHHAKRFAVSAELLRGIARTESGMRPWAINSSHVARTGTRDIGLMQINSSFLPKLAAYGISERQLLDPCTSIEVGAWVLAGTLRRHGDSWEGVGAYNAACTQLRGKACTEARSKYAWAVYRRMDAVGPPAFAQAPLDQPSWRPSGHSDPGVHADRGIFSLNALALGSVQPGVGWPR